MKNRIVAIVVCCFLLLGCAAISQQAKMEEYTRTMDAYEAAMRVSDFNTACQYIDPAKMERRECLTHYENLKLVSYDILGVDVSPDKLDVNHAIEAQYYFLDRYVLKKIQYEQSWHFKEDIEKWLLQTRPPHFE